MGFRIVHTGFDQTPKAKAKKKPDYLSFLHSLPCVVTGKMGVEAAHLSYAAPEYGHYGRGRGTKIGDRWALPLSPEHHRMQHSMNEERYWAGTGINPHVLALTLFGLWSDLGDDAEEYATAIIMKGLS